MDRIARHAMKNGKDINEVLKMPWQYVLELTTDEVKDKQPKEEQSLIAAFGG